MANNENGGVYEDPNGNIRKLIWPLDLKENVVKKVYTYDYEWNLRYILSQKIDTMELQIYSEFTSRYTFQDRVELEITIDSSDGIVTKKIELPKTRGEQCFNVEVTKENGSMVEKVNVKLTFTLAMAAIKHCGDWGTIAVFTDADHPHDVVLIVGETKFYVYKTYLATWSKFFDILFFGDFAEKDKKEIKIEDVKASEFETLLNIIHPFLLRQVNDFNVEYLLKLGDRFDMPSVMAMCAVHLTNFENCKDMSLMDRLEFSDKYNLSRLQVVCLKKCHEMNAGDFKSFLDINRDRIRKLSANTVQNLI